jgi:hypothetical protein
MGPTGSQGPTGPEGPQGTPGTPGVDGVSPNLNNINVYGLTVNAVSGATLAIDLSVSRVFSSTLTAATTVSAPTNVPTERHVQFSVVLTQDSTGSRVATWPASFKWPSGSAGVLSTAANSVDVLHGITINGGTTWLVALAKGFA